MKQVQWFDSRFYKVITQDGIEYFPSVTTILQVSPKPFLAKWRGDVGNEEADRVMNEARHRGVIIHSACEELVNGAVIALVCDGYERVPDKELTEIMAYRKVVRIYDQDHYWQVMKFKMLMEALSPSEIETEHTVYSTKFRYAGTMDYLMHLESGSYEIDGAKPVQISEGWYIADIKTGNSLSDDVWLQMAAYRQAVLENRGLEISGAIAIHTNATTKKGIEGLSAKLRTESELDVDFQNFMKVYDVWAINPTATAPRVFTMPVLLQWKAPKPISKAIPELDIPAPTVAAEGMKSVDELAPAAKAPDAPPAKRKKDLYPNELDKHKVSAAANALPQF